jgi:hypothetical protein
MIVLRFLLRFLLIPLGGAVALACAAVVLVITAGTRFLSALTAINPDAGAGAVITMVSAAPGALVAALAASFTTVLVALLAVALAEIVAIRSVLFYAAAGGLAAFIGWWAMDAVHRDALMMGGPTVIAAAGIIGGLGYWLVAGWNAGFWKPVFAPTPTQPIIPPSRA